MRDHNWICLNYWLINNIISNRILTLGAKLVKRFLCLLFLAWLTGS